MHRKIKSLLMLMLSFLTIALPLSTEAATPEAYCLLNYQGRPDLTSKWLYIFTFPNQETISLKFKETHPFLMVNGTFVPTANIQIINNRSFIPLRIVSEELGMNVRWDASSQTAIIQKNTLQITVKPNQEKFLINGVEALSEDKVCTINGSLYVPLRFLEKAFPITLNYIPYKESSPFYLLGNPLITIDENSTQKQLTKEEAFQFLHAQLLEAYNNFLTNQTYNQNTEYSNSILDRLKTDIDSIQCTGKISRYWVFTGPYPILLDAFTGDIYFAKSKIVRSYIEKMIITDPEVFALDYFLG